MALMGLILLSFGLFIMGLRNGLIALILVEMFTLLSFITLSVWFSSTASFMLISCSVFVITATSAAMGLSLLVALARTHGESWLALVSA